MTEARASFDDWTWTRASRRRRRDGAPCSCNRPQAEPHRPAPVRWTGPSPCGSARCRSIGSGFSSRRSLASRWRPRQRDDHAEVEAGIGSAAAQPLHGDPMARGIGDDDGHSSL
ncbi:MAG: hypothetical protein MZV70_52220 [Desulfobacterales bacterium]|nr:hypothetical protein [Desulfobacterales bacterium]